MKVLDLFSGIGGFSLGLERAGMQTIAFCEIEDYPRKVLAKHWPGIPIHKDIRDLDGRRYRGTIDVVCGGFPCQPFSAAGKRRGKDDDRDLWPEMFRVIREVQPAWIIGENVAGFVNMELDRTLSDLEGAGYACQTFDIPAVGVDAPHIRQRVWIVAHAECRNGQRWRAECGNEVSAGSCNAIDRPGSNSFDVADTKGFAFDGKRESGTPRHRLQARRRSGEHRTGQWEPEPAVGRVANGIPNRMDRLKGLGNAVVPQIPELIARAILEASEARP